MTGGLSRNSDYGAEPLSTLEELVERALEGYAANTVAGYRRDLREWFEFCAAVLDKHPLETDRFDVQRWAAYLLEARGLKPKSQQRKISALSAFSVFLVQEGTLATNPAQYVRRAKVSDEVVPVGLEASEAHRLVEAAEAAGPVPFAAVCLLLYPALRVSEACHARLEDIERRRGRDVLHVVRKGGTIHEAPLSPVTMHAVELAAAGRKTGPILVDDAGEALTRHAVAYILKGVCHRAGIEKHITPHSLRHTAATLALDAGTPLDKVQDLMGHRDPKTTRHYDRARGRIDDAATYTLESYIAVEGARDR